MNVIGQRKTSSANRDVILIQSSADPRAIQDFQHFKHTLAGCCFILFAVIIIILIIVSRVFAILAQVDLIIPVSSSPAARGLYNLVKKKKATSEFGWRIKESVD